MNRQHFLQVDPPVRQIDVAFAGPVRLSYSPFIDKKRALLTKFFFPQSYNWKAPTPEPPPGAQRYPRELAVNVSFKDVLLDFKFHERRLADTQNVILFKFLPERNGRKPALIQYAVFSGNRSWTCFRY